MTGRLRTVVVGDALLPTELIGSSLGDLREHLEIAGALTWGPADEREVDRMALRLEREGPDAEPPPPDLVDRLGDADILVVHYCPVSERVLEAAPNLRILATCRAGTENIAAQAAAERGISVFHVIGRTTEAVSDFAIGLLLAEARNIARAHHAAVSGEWRKSFRNSPFTPELERKTVGIVGFGEIGEAVARKLSGFHVRLLATDPGVPPDRIRAGWAEPVDLDRLLEESDFVTLHARPEPGSGPILGREQFRRMKRTAFLVNTARAALVDTAALVDALERGDIAGAALDVHDEEPLPTGHRLLGLDNVTLTPHLASSTRECGEKSPRLLAEDLRRFFEGGEPRFALTPDPLSGGWR